MNKLAESPKNYSSTEEIKDRLTEIRSRLNSINDRVHKLERKFMGTTPVIPGVGQAGNQAQERSWTEEVMELLTEIGNNTSDLNVRISNLENF